jgi:hypothetical protein
MRAMIHSKRVNKVIGMLSFSFALLFANGVVLGQGGTGKESANANSNKTEKTRNKNNSSAVKHGSSNESSYIPTGPTAKDLIFLRDFMKSHGHQTFTPIDRCKASIQYVDTSSRDFFGHIKKYIFSFSDIDVSQITAQLGESATYIHLRSTDGRKVIRRQLIEFPNGKSTQTDTDRLELSFEDSRVGENQAKVITALKSLIETCAHP